MATPTYDLLDSTTLASSASSVTFTNIDQSYGDLVLVVEGATSQDTNGRVSFNGDSANNYRRIRMRGNGSSTNTGISVDNELVEQIGTLGFFSKIEIMDYSATDKHKSVLVRSNKDTSLVYAFAARWANTSAITSLEFYPTAGTLDSGSTFYLYGIAK